MFPAVAWGKWVLWGWLPVLPVPSQAAGEQRSLVGLMRILHFSGLSISGPPNSSQNCTYKPGKPESLPPVLGAAPVGKCQSKWWLPGQAAGSRKGQQPGCLRGPPWSLPRVLPAGVAASGGEMSRAKREAGRAGRTGTHSCVCHLAQRALHQSSQAPCRPDTCHGTEASLFPPCRTDTPAPRGGKAAVFD